MDFIVRSNNNPVNDMTAIMSGIINDLDKAIKTNSSQSLFFVIVSFISIDKPILGGWSCNREGQAAVQ